MKNFNIKIGTPSDVGQLYNVSVMEDSGGFGSFLATIVMLLTLWPISLFIIWLIGGAERFAQVFGFATDSLIGFIIGILWIPTEAMWWVLFSPIVIISKLV
jgi:hypothetical protein